MRPAFLFLISLCSLLISNLPVFSNTAIQGELKKWHKVTFLFDGINTGEGATSNPFTDYRLTVTFTKGDKSYVIPGHYAADGNAAETSDTSGNKWRAYFTPDEIGFWNYSVSFRSGSNIAIDPSITAGVAVVPLDGTAGTFYISATDKSGKDFRNKGMLRYVGEHYLQFAEKGEYYLKGGADSPENFLGYFEFDQTIDMGGHPTPGLIDGLHRYGVHVQQWQQGDPTWQNGKGKGIIGALNYIASKGVNSVYFLTYNIDGGDGMDTWVWTDPNERHRFDVSKLDQWEIVFSHMDALGIQLHVITQETENDQRLGGSGSLSDIRKLYYRELVSRFSHHLAVQWNIGEENTNSDFDKAAFAEYIRTLDPYDHPINVHTQYGNASTYYSGILNNPSYLQYFEATSIQGNASSYNDWAISLRNASAAVGKKWMIYGDEQGPAVNPDGTNFSTLRRYALWGNLMGGGAGVEWYFGYQNTFGDLQSEDWQIVEGLWVQTANAINFFQNYLPFHEMEPDNHLLSAQTNDVCFAKEGEVYALYLHYGGGGAPVNLYINAAGSYTIKWYHPTLGGCLHDGTITSIEVTSPGNRLIGKPPFSNSSDWAVLVVNDNSLCHITSKTCDDNFININYGWNLVSTFLVPNYPDMLEILNDVSSDIVIIKNALGQSAIPSLGINVIGDWDITQGYKVKAADNTSLEIGCMLIDPGTTPIDLPVNWSIMPYLRNTPMDIATVISGIASDVTLVKDALGRTYIPSFGINTIGFMNPGQGYKIKMNNPVTFIFPANSKFSENTNYRMVAEPVYYNTPHGTGHNATIILPVEYAPEFIHVGDEIGVYNMNGMLVGASVYEGRNLAITVWGDDLTTANVVEGMEKGEPFVFHYWDNIRQLEKPLMFFLKVKVINYMRMMACILSKKSTLKK